MKIGQLVYVIYQRKKRRAEVTAIDGDLVRVRLRRTRSVVQWYRAIDVEPVPGR